MMKRLLFMFAFLVSFGFAAVGQESVDPNPEESQEQTSEENQNPSTVDGITTVTLDGSQTLAELLGDQKDEVLYLKLVGPLTKDDFTTMRGMSALKIIDMAGVTQLPFGDWHGMQMIPSEAFGGQNPKLGLERVIFPACLEIIESSAFSGCTSLSKADFSLATQLNTIGSSAFNNCSALLEITLSNCSVLQTIDNAFSYCTGLKSVNLSNCSSLREIKGYAFYACSALTTVNLDNCDRLTLIGEESFWGCSKLTTVKLNGCTALSTIDNNAFGGWSNNAYLDFDFSQLTSLNSIGANAFAGRGLSGEITFASQISQLGVGAFNDCDKITSISFANCPELTVISSNTFGDCDLLETVDFTGCSKLSTLQKNAFTNCPSLKRVIIDNSYYKTTDDVLFRLKTGTYDKEALQLYPAGKTDASYEIPTSTQIIYIDAFPYNTHLKNVNIPSSISEIEADAFGEKAYYSPSIRMNLKVTMESATPIKLDASIGLENSVIIVPEEGLEAYKSKDYWKDYRIIKAGESEMLEIHLEGTQTLASQLTDVVTDMITQIKITGNVKSSDFPTLKQMHNLRKLDLSEARLENNIVPNEAFYGHTILEEIILPTTVETIDQWAFHSCPSLKSINLDALSSLTRIEQSAFFNCPSFPTELKLPSSIKFLGYSSFKGTNISTIDFSNTNIENISSEAFRDCPITGTLSFPASLSTINSYAFEQANVSEIHLNAFNTWLNQGNFSSTDKEECKVYVPYGSMTDYKNSDYWRDFSNIIEEEAPKGESLVITLTEKGSLENYLTINEINVENVTELTIAGPMDWRDIEQICTMSKLQKLNMLDVRMENDYLPESAFVIWSMDYEGPALRFLKEVVLPKGLQSIGSNAFWNYKRLSKVVLPTTLKRLDGFSYCSMLGDINIGDCTSLEYIGGFDGCTSLPSTLVLPNSVKEIGSFRGSSITYIDLSETSINTIGWYTFNDCQLTGDWIFPGTLSYIREGAFNTAKFSSIKFRNLEKVILDKKNAFPNVDLNNFKIYVPNSLVENYKLDTYWYDYRNNIVGFGNTIMATPNNSDWGTVTGSGAYDQNDQVILRATCHDWINNYVNKYGYLFVGWFEGDQKLSEKTTYQLTADNQDHAIKAIFERILFSDNNDWITIVNYDTKSVTATIDLTYLDSETFFTGWYEDDVCISKDQTVTVQVKDGSKERTISPHFEGKANWLENTTISDAKKVDDQDVEFNRNVTITGNEIWKLNSIQMNIPWSSVLIESPVETNNINLNLYYTYEWRFLFLPYELNITDIKWHEMESQFVVRYYDGNERAKNGPGNSWKQLKKTDKLEANKGYIFKASNGDSRFTLNTSTGMEALLTTKAVTIPLQKHESVAMPDANWNLIGNPFPCYFRTKSLFEEGGLDGTITVWDSDIQNYQYYTQDDDAYIAPLTAFFVQHNQATSVTFHPDGRAAKLPEGTTRSASALRSGDGRQVLNLVLSNDSLSDKTRIVFNEAAKAGYELGLDASKFRSMNPNAPAFYSIDADNQQLAINERPWDNGVVRLGCNFGVKGEYSIALQETVEQDLILVDKVTGAQTNLKEQAYRFSAEVGESNDRFELRSGNPTGMEEIAGFQWQVRGGQLFLTGLPTNARVIVHDTMGRTVCDRTVSDELSGLALPQVGVYYLTIRTQQATRTERIMVKE
ncbi:leucine-rich repeat protein [Parabacteroides distasonis]|nr:leucine-rich repeat protein [Parabacteroides distasonis]